MATSSEEFHGDSDGRTVVCEKIGFFVAEIVSHRAREFHFDHKQI
jgi:hypothetical protein